MNSFVGTQNVDSSEALCKLLSRYKTEDSRYFLRWAHDVSGFIQELPSNFPSPEGQMFSRDRELRWKQQGNGYSVLLLSTLGTEPNFSPVGQHWKTQDRSAYVHSTTETRFPKGISALKGGIGQRYFMDAQTSTVHFVALTVQS
ncbi:MAG: hypothetical protein LRZ84_13735 [Desertifilum sp.]|nr:hypothetical protein [Desertifilum sp.]